MLTSEQRLEPFSFAQIGFMESCLDTADHATMRWSPVAIPTSCSVEYHKVVIPTRKISNRFAWAAQVWLHHKSGRNTTVLRDKHPGDLSKDLALYESSRRRVKFLNHKEKQISLNYVESHCLLLAQVCVASDSGRSSRACGGGLPGLFMSNGDGGLCSCELVT